LRGVLPDVSYFAKGLIVVLIFISIYAGGLYCIMKRATYRTFNPPSHLDNIGAGSYIRAREKYAARTRKFFKREE
jgi:hypothetical protein